MATQTANIDDPPYDTNGSGSPATGMMPSVIPMFSNAWKANQAMMPAATIVPYSSVVSRAIRQARHRTTPRRTRISPAPRKPSSSPATVKTKSVCCSGTNWPVVWVPWKRPVPVSPPEPMAMRAWLVL